MTRRRWIADEVEGEKAALVGDHAAHLARVLRAQVGQEFDIATGNNVRRGTITSLSESRVEFSLGSEVASAVAPQLTLVMAIYKFDRMEWAIEKCTEIGVARIVPLIARRTDSHLGAAASKRRERWERISRHASEQSRRASTPEIAEPVKLKDLGRMPGGAASGLRVVLSESEKNVRLRDAFEGSPASAALAIGPEGGWAPDELEFFRDAAWVAASLGNTILRAETAAIVAAAIAMDMLA